MNTRKQFLESNGVLRVGLTASSGKRPVHLRQDITESDREEAPRRLLIDDR